VINGRKKLCGWNGLSIDRSIDREIMQIKTRRIWKSLVDEDSTVVVDSNYIEPKVVNPLRTIGSYVTPWMDKLHKSSCTNKFYI
jgi:hypothetical protein